MMYDRRGAVGAASSCAGQHGLLINVLRMDWFALLDRQPFLLPNCPFDLCDHITDPLRCILSSALAVAQRLEGT